MNFQNEVCLVLTTNDGSTKMVYIYGPIVIVE